MEDKTPQLEDGYTRIANDIIIALARSMPGFTEGQIIWFILRKTYGWNKKEDKISLSQIITATGKSKRMVIYALQNLEAKRMIKIKRQVVDGEKQPNTISFNKNHSEWVVQEKSNKYEIELQRRKKYYRDIVQEKTKDGGSARNGNEVVQENSKEVVQEPVQDVLFLAHTKDTITKDIYTKDTIQKKDRPFSKIESLTDEVLQEISEKYQVPLSFVVSKLDDLQNYVAYKGRVYKNYKAALANFVKADALKIKQTQNDKSKIGFINPR